MFILLNGIWVSLKMITSVTILAINTINMSMTNMIHLGRYPKFWNLRLKRKLFINSNVEIALLFKRIKFR